MSIKISSVAGFVFLIIIAFAGAPKNAVAQTGTDPNAGVAAAVQSYFADVPVMIAIATCESGPRQFADDGTPLLGGAGDMVGVFQFDKTVHSARALALGFDINTLTGNMGYARYLYGAAGTNPWISSFECWKSSVGIAATSTISTTATDIPVLTLDLMLGATDPQVLILQQMLNRKGFILAQEGPGSPGNETTKFGSLTYAALKKFQCAQGIACSGEEATTGYGLLNAATRAKLLAVDSDATGTIAVADNPAEIAQLQSRIASLLAILTQLQAALAARSGH